MTKYIHYFIYVLLSQLLPSCADVLDRQPLDKISEKDVWNDESMMRAYVTNLYSRFPFFAFETYSWYSITDEGTLSTGGTNAGSVSRSSELNPFWDYQYIRDCNVFLENVTSAPINDAVKSQLEGEVRFIRAYTYFEMMKRYGGVPLVDVVIDPFSPVEKKYTQRASEETIARFILAELDIAKELLSDNPLPRGRVNKWTALALKARSALWAASIARYGELASNGFTGIPSDQATQFYTVASQAAEEVIAAGKYSLYMDFPDDKSENYRKLFLQKNNPEVIFEKPYDGVNIGHSWDAWHAPPQWAARGGTGNPTLEFILGYENIDGSTDQPNFDGALTLYDDGRGPFIKKDPRLFATVFFQGDPWANGVTQTYEGLDPSASPDPAQVIRNPNVSYENVPAVGPDSRSIAKDDLSTNSGFLIKKYIDDAATTIPEGQSKTNWIVFRLAEMYITKAEALFETGNKKEAAEALNYTRNRAGISLVDESTITLQKIQSERRAEFAFEAGHRFWDLRRWRIAHQILNHRFQGLQIIRHHATDKFYFIPFNCESFTRVFRQEHYYNPITTARINNNPDLVENPLY